MLQAPPAGTHRVGRPGRPFHRRDRRTGAANGLCDDRDYLVVAAAVKLVTATGPAAPTRSGAGVTRVRPRSPSPVAATATSAWLCAASGRGRGLGASQHDAAGRRVDRAVRPEHRRADRYGQLPDRPPHRPTSAGDRGHSRLHHGLRYRRRDTRPWSDRGRGPTSVPAPARRAQDRRRRTQSGPRAQDRRRRTHRSHRAAARAAAGAPGDSRRALRLLSADTSRLRRSGSGGQRIRAGEVRDQALSTGRGVVQKPRRVCAAGHQRGVGRSGVGRSVCAHKYAVADPPIDEYSDYGRAMMTDQNEE